MIILIFEILGISAAGPGITWVNSLASVLILLIALFLLKKRVHCPETPSVNLDDEKIHFLTFITIAVSAGILLIFAASSITAPPPPTDAFLDHLVFPAEWLQSARIFPVQTLSPDQATTYYPANAELIYLWLMLPFHDDLLTGLLEPLSLLLCWLASCRLFTRMGLSKNLSMSVAAVAACAPGVIIMTLHSGVDLFFTFAILTCAAFLVPDANGERSTSELAVAGLAAGLAAGTKYVGIVSVVFLLPLIFFAGKCFDLRRRVTDFLTFSMFALLSGGFWYIRNFLLTGSPIYPMGLQIAGHNIFTGAFYRDAMFNAYLHISSGDFKYFSGVLLNVLAGKWFFAIVATGYVTYRIFIVKKGRALAIASGAAVAAALILYKCEYGNGLDGAILIFLCVISMAVMLISFSGVEWWKKYVSLLGPILILAYWFINPYNTANNYRFMAPAVFFIAGALFASGKDAIEKFFVFAISITALISNHEFLFNILRIMFGALSSNPTEWQKTAAFTALFAISFCLMAIISFAFFIARKQSFGIVSLAISIALIAFFLSSKTANMEAGRYAWYQTHYLGDGWSALSKIKTPVTVAYAGNCSPYGLYGNKLKNKVRYINLDGAENLIFHDYEKQLRNQPGYIMPVESVGLNYIFRDNADYDEWLKALYRDRVDVLFVTREFYRGIISDPQELQWALSHQETFKLLFNKKDAFIFAINRK